MYKVAAIAYGIIISTAFICATVLFLNDKNWQAVVILVLIITSKLVGPNNSEEKKP